MTSKFPISKRCRIPLTIISPLLLLLVCLTITASAAGSGNPPLPGKVQHHSSAITSTWTVAPSGANFQDPQSAIDAAGEGDLIKVAAGTFTGTITLNKTVFFRGGYDATNFDAPPNPTVNVTTLDAEGDGTTLRITSGVSPTVDGFRITGGDGITGGAINNGNNGSTIRNNVIHNNTGGYGGGIYLNGGSPTIEDNTIRNNTGEAHGGGLYLNRTGNGTIIKNNIIKNNTADTLRGGGIMGYNSPATLDGNTISGNTAQTNGGGMYLDNSDATVNANTISNNIANINGGGIYIEGENPDLTNNVIAKNIANNDGNGVYVKSGDPNLRHNTISRNHGGEGSGIYVSGGTARLVNTILVSHTVGIQAETNTTVTLEATLWGTDTWGNETDWIGEIAHTLDLWGDPAFIDPGNSNLHIGTTSAAKNTCVSAGVDEDADELARPQNYLYDCGAYEFLEGIPLVVTFTKVPSHVHWMELVTFTAQTNMSANWTWIVDTCDELEGITCPITITKDISATEDSIEYAWISGHYDVEVIVRSNGKLDRAVHRVHVPTKGFPPMPELDSIVISGTQTGETNTIYTFTANISPTEVGILPYIYVWRVSQQGQLTPTHLVTHTGAGDSDWITISWDSPNITSTIVVTSGGKGNWVTDTHTVTIIPSPVELVGVTIVGPPTGTINSPIQFVATVNPTYKLEVETTFVWTVDDKTIVRDGWLSSSLELEWTDMWKDVCPHDVSVFATNGSNTVTDTHSINIAQPQGWVYVYLPLISKEPPRRTHVNDIF